MTTNLVEGINRVLNSTSHFLVMVVVERNYCKFSALWYIQQNKMVDMMATKRNLYEIVIKRLVNDHCVFEYWSVIFIHVKLSSLDT